MTSANSVRTDRGNDVALSYWSAGHLTSGDLDLDATRAFEELFRRYHPQLVRWCRHRFRDAAFADDVAQEAMLRALRYGATFDVSRPRWPWLKAIAINVGAEMAFRRRHEVLSGTLQLDEAAAVDDPAPRVEERSVLDLALGRLPQRQQEALRLRYVDDRSSAEVASAFGLSQAAVDQLMHRSRLNLLRHYTRANRDDSARRGGLVPVLALGGWLRRTSGVVFTRRAADGATTGGALVGSAVLTSATAMALVGVIGAGVVAVGSAQQPLIEGRVFVQRGGEDVRGAAAPAVQITHVRDVRAPEAEASPAHDEPSSVAPVPPTEVTRAATSTSTPSGVTPEVEAEVERDGERLRARDRVAIGDTGVTEGEVWIECDTEVRRAVCDAVVGANEAAEAVASELPPPPLPEPLG